MKGKTLIAYFSAEGTTAAVADILAKTLHADLFAIRSAAPYTAEDLNWMNKNSRSSAEMADPDARPALKESADISAYDTVSSDSRSGGTSSRASWTRFLTALCLRVKRSSPLPHRAAAA